MHFNESCILTQDPGEIKKVVLGKGNISIEEFVAAARYKAEIEFSDRYRETVNSARRLVEKLSAENRVIYGVTTGFGDNVRHTISPEHLELLQKNLVRSHACAVGEPLEQELVRAVMLMILLNAGTGYTGLSLEVLELIRCFLNRGITPFAPGEGSVGYLSVEGHIALVLIGEGKAWYDGELCSGDSALYKAGLEPLTLGCKEGLSLLNGSTSVTGIAILAVYDAVTAAKVMDIAAALSYEGLRSTVKALDKRLHSVKNHAEQQRSAENIAKMLKDSEIARMSADEKIQDAISLRAAPHMHGAAKRLLREALVSIYEEMTSCSDNPIIYPEDGDGVALMGGSFDASYVGSHADCACIAMAMMAKSSERRIDRLTNRHLSGLPSFLVTEPGLNNGYMIPQYTAAGLLGEIRILSHPSSIDNVPTCANQEDVITMSYFASKKAYQIARKLHYIIAIEIMLAVQALDILKLYKPSSATSSIYELVRKEVPALNNDRYIYPDIEHIFNLVRNGKIIKTVKQVVGELEF